MAASRFLRGCGPKAPVFAFLGFAYASKLPTCTLIKMQVKCYGNKSDNCFCKTLSDLQYVLSLNVVQC